MASILASDAGTDPPLRQSSVLVIGASSLGTVFEWYDFYLYGLLATVISAQFFSGVNETTGFIFALAAFAAGFAVRPFGALVFGRIGDLVGRKYTFLVTMGIMGLSTFARRPAAELRLDRRRRADRCWSRCGCCRASRSAANMAARRPMSPSMRRDGKRGLYTSFIQTTATLGLFAALLVVIGIRTALGEEAFADWGWRMPFLVSIAAARRLAVDPAAARREPGLPEDEGRRARTSKAPLTEAFGALANLQASC